MRRRAAGRVELRFWTRHKAHALKVGVATMWRDRVLPDGGRDCPPRHRRLLDAAVLRRHRPTPRPH